MSGNNGWMDTISLRLGIAGVTLDSIPMAMLIVLESINTVNLIRYNQEKEQPIKPKARKMGRDFVAWAIASGWSHGALYANTDRGFQQHKVDIETEIQGIFDI